MSVPIEASDADIAAAVKALRAGELVAFPTETVYGLGADAGNSAALSRVYAAKGRPTDHPLILHLADVAQLTRWVAALPAPTATRVEQLAQRFWPGPLTLVLPCAAEVSPVLTGGQTSLAVRVPSHPVAQRLLRAFGSGIAAPSANRYGRVSPTRAVHVREEFPEGVMILEGGDCEVGVESTILSLLETPPRILRPGIIGRESLEALIGPLALGSSTTVPRVPGSMPQHYAPQTPVELVAVEALDARIKSCIASGEAVAVLARSAPETRMASARGAISLPVRRWLQAPASSAAYAHDLYANLRSLDKENAARILIEQVPTSPEWDAVRDRLSRAAAR
ncbi:MAG: threonylcarbamoyl-AMP synthase [Gammaproteobacteria bacterium]|nr:threonylcarbamoyl-AMP synthase [Gammaproteobacteria bacterium]